MKENTRENDRPMRERCVCVCERERERERGKEGGRKVITSTHVYILSVSVYRII